MSGLGFGALYKIARRLRKMNSFIAITLLAVVGVAVAAPAKYGHDGGHHAAVHPGPAVVHTYPAVAPVVKCGHNLLISCNPHHQAVPCKAAEHGHHGGYHGGHHAPAPAPAYHHAPAPHHHAPAPAYHGAAEHGEYRAKKHHGKKHHKKGKSADNVGEAMDSSSEMMVIRLYPSCAEVLVCPVNGRPVVKLKDNTRNAEVRSSFQKNSSSVLALPADTGATTT
uniref:VM domain-containing protein n=1 Tax=Anopheles farauti TaxID=69004 RepID=A0A182QZ39_9DIPT